MKNRLIQFIEEKYDDYPGTPWVLAIMVALFVSIYFLLPQHPIPAYISGFFFILCFGTLIWLWFLDGTRIGKVLLVIGKAILHLARALDKAIKASNNRSMKNNRNLNQLTISHCDKITGRTFEIYLKDLFEKMGYKTHLTPNGNDQGADLVVWMNGKKYVVQAKRYKQNVGNKAVQEVHSAQAYYGCDAGMVVTNSYFTKSAIELGKRTKVELIDRNTLAEWLSRYTVHIK